ncbi:MAG: hypothetical protein ACRBF0_09255 [Calditrichia bacterium]
MLTFLGVRYFNVIHSTELPNLHVQNDQNEYISIQKKTAKLSPGGKNDAEQEWRLIIDQQNGL